MSGGFGNLLGGSKSKIKDVTPDELKSLRGPFANVFKGLLQGGYADPLKGIPQSQAATTGYAAPMTPAEEQGLKDLAAAVGPETARARLLNDTLEGKFADPASNPFLQAYTEAQQRQTAKTYEDVLGRVLPGQFTAKGHSVQPGGSSPFAMAAAREAEGFANALKDIATGIGFQAYEAERGRQQEAIGLSQQEVDSGIKALQQQALPRLIQQHGIDQGLAEFQQRSQALLQLLSILSGGALSQQATATKESPNILAPVAGATGAALAGG
jgi:hypothetical protein